MPATLDLTESNSMTALRSFLLNILPNGIEVIQAQGNRVPEPSANDFVLMTPLFRERLETNTTTYIDEHLTSGPELRIDLQPTKLTVQVDVHGPNSGNNMQVITTLFFSEYAVEQFAISGFDVTPLYHGTPKQVPFINGEQQYEQRWTVDLHMQINPSTTVTQQFADQLEVGVISVQAEYPIN
jgi:hypothetical protein